MLLFGRKQRRYIPINPALFLTQALRSLEEARSLEAQGNNGNALRIYITLVQTFQNAFTIPGPAGQERIKPLDDKNLILQLIEVIEETRQGFDRTHSALPIQAAVNIRSNYYPSPSYPAEVSPALKWLRSVAATLPASEPKDVKSKQGSEIQQPTQNGVTSVTPKDGLTFTPSEECLVCGDKFGTGDGEVPRPSRAPTTACTHPADVCVSCLSQTISAHIDMHGGAHAISCPNSDCPEAMSREDVREWAPDNVFARWDMLHLREMMRNDQGLFIWCQNPACYSGQLHPEGESQPIVTCVRCSGRTCFVHNVVYHEGQTCKQYDRSLPIKDALNRAANRVVIWWSTRKCPGCFQPIQKRGGCRHMHCRCGYYYTWWYAPIHYRRFIPFIRPRSPGI